MTGPEDNDGRFPDEAPVLTPYPLTPEQAHGDRAAWPWLRGWIVSQCGPDEWEVCVQEPALAHLDDGTIPPPGTPEDECQWLLAVHDPMISRSPPRDQPPGRTITEISGSLG